MNRGYCYLLVTFFCWGSLYIASKFALAYIPPCTMLFLRQLLGVLFLWLIARKQGMKPVRREHRIMFFGVGLLGYFLATALQTMSTNVMNASVSALINTVNPVSISLFAVLFLKETMTRRKLLGLACSMTGVVAVMGIDAQGINLPGVILSLSSVLFWSLNSILQRKLSVHYPSAQIAFLGISAGLPYCLVASAVELYRQPITSMHWSAIVSVLVMGSLCTALPNLTWNAALHLLDASVCALFYPLQPLFATILSILILGETISIGFILGGILISLGVVMGLRQPKLIKA